ncbi:MAG: hypothetical protein ACRCS2_06960, partial [Morganella morganii]
MLIQREELGDFAVTAQCIGRDIVLGVIKIACGKITNIYKNFVKSENLGMANLLIYYVSKNSSVSS